MRGIKINKPSRNLDIVVVSARYRDDRMLDFARGYERRGYVWSDIRIYDRESLIEKVRSDASVYTGDPVKVPGNYEPEQRVRITGPDGKAFLVTNGSGAEGDDLGVPIL